MPGCCSSVRLPPSWPRRLRPATRRPHNAPREDRLDARAPDMKARLGDPPGPARRRSWACRVCRTEAAVVCTACRHFPGKLALLPSKPPKDAKTYRCYPALSSEPRWRHLVDCPSHTRSLSDFPLRLEQNWVFPSRRLETRWRHQGENAWQDHGSSGHWPLFRARSRDR